MNFEPNNGLLSDLSNIASAAHIITPSSGEIALACLCLTLVGSLIIPLLVALVRLSLKLLVWVGRTLISELASAIKSEVVKVFVGMTVGAALGATAASTFAIKLLLMLGIQ